MKRLIVSLLSVVVALGICLGLVGCGGEKTPSSNYLLNDLNIVLEDNFGETYTIEHKHNEFKGDFFYTQNISCPARFGKTLTLTTKGIYDKNGTPLDKNLYTADCETDTETVDLSSLGSQTLQNEYTIVLIDKNGKDNSAYRINVTINVTVTSSKERIGDYVQIKEFSLPSAFFDCELQEVSADYYDVFSVTDMLGRQDTDNYEYGVLVESLSEDHAVTTRSSEICDHKTQGETIYEINHYHYIGKDNGKLVTESYQYEQLKNGTGYSMNDTDGIFSCGPFSKQGVSNWIDCAPDRLAFLSQTEILTYQAAEKDGYLYLSVSAEYTSSKYYGFPEMSCEILYVISEDCIIGGLYVETASSPATGGYWKTTQYCIPLEGDVALLDEELLLSLCSD